MLCSRGDGCGAGEGVGVVTITQWRGGCGDHYPVEGWVW